jgi:hypothetical protein
MVFIDGTWLWHNLMSHQVKMDMYKLPREIIRSLGKTAALVGVIFCASLPENVATCDKKALKKRERFYKLLGSKCGYNLEIYRIDFRGNRFFKKDRSESSNWEPKEKCVDIAVASNIILHHDRYDHAILISGDRDYLPALDKIKDLGKSVTVASFRDSCSQELQDTYQTIFLEDLLEKVTLI